MRLPGLSKQLHVFDASKKSCQSSYKIMGVYMPYWIKTIDTIHLYEWVYVKRNTHSKKKKNAISSMKLSLKPSGCPKKSVSFCGYVQYRVSYSESKFQSSTYPCQLLVRRRYNFPLSFSHFLSITSELSVCWKKQSKLNQIKSVICQALVQFRWSSIN